MVQTFHTPLVRIKYVHVAVCRMHAPTSHACTSTHEHTPPSALVARADKTRPHSLELLGKQLVLWYDAPAATWRACDDVCPHRWAARPLTTKSLACVCMVHGSHRQDLHGGHVDTTAVRSAHADLADLAP
jgi:hypothetical protein